jgi:hypothetical protein
MRLYDFGIGLFLAFLAVFVAGAATERSEKFLPDVQEEKVGE